MCLVSSEKKEHTKWMNDGFGTANTIEKHVINKPDVA